jgi:hypothetical protein
MEKIIHHVKRVRNQPEHIRQSILHILTLASGVILFILWVFSLGSGPSDTNTSQTLKENLAPLSALKANLTDGFNSISDGSNTDMQTETDPELELDTTY